MPPRHTEAQGATRLTEEEKLQVWHVLLIILVILIIALVVLYFVGKRLQKKQDASREQIEAAKQQMTLLIIDKKRMRVKDAGLPQMVVDQVPKLMRRNKLPIVKVKAGPKIMDLIADEKIVDVIPVGKSGRATVSGIYITDVKAIRGKLETPPKKKSFRQRLLRAQSKAEAELKAESKTTSKTKKKR